MPQVADIFMLRAAFSRQSIHYRIGKSVRSFMEEQLKSAEILVGWIAARKCNMRRESCIGVTECNHIVANVHANRRWGLLLVQIFCHRCSQFRSEGLHSLLLR